MKTTVLCVDEEDYVIDAVRRHCHEGWAFITQHAFYDPEVKGYAVALTFEREEEPKE